MTEIACSLEPIAGRDSMQYGTNSDSRQGYHVVCLCLSACGFVL